MISRIGLGHDDGSVTTTPSTFPLFTKALINLKMCLLLHHTVIINPSGASLFFGASRC